MPDFKCPECSALMEVKEEWDGMEAECQGCGKDIIIDLSAVDDIEDVAEQQEPDAPEIESPPESAVEEVSEQEITSSEPVDEDMRKGGTMGMEAILAPRSKEKQETMEKETAPPVFEQKKASGKGRKIALLGCALLLLMAIVAAGIFGIRSFLSSKLHDAPEETKIAENKLAPKTWPEGTGYQKAPKNKPNTPYQVEPTFGEVQITGVSGKQYLLKGDIEIRNNTMVVFYPGKTITNLYKDKPSLAVSDYNGDKCVLLYGMSAKINNYGQYEFVEISTPAEIEKAKKPKPKPKKRKTKAKVTTEKEPPEKQVDIPGIAGVWTVDTKQMMSSYMQAGLNKWQAAMELASYLYVKFTFTGNKISMKDKTFHNDVATFKIFSFASEEKLLEALAKFHGNSKTDQVKKMIADGKLNLVIAEITSSKNLGKDSNIFKVGQKLVIYAPGPKDSKRDEMAVTFKEYGNKIRAFPLKKGNK